MTSVRRCASWTSRTRRIDSSSAARTCGSSRARARRRGRRPAPAGRRPDAVEPLGQLEHRRLAAVADGVADRAHGSTAPPRRRAARAAGRRAGRARPGRDRAGRCGGSRGQSRDAPSRLAQPLERAPAGAPAVLARPGGRPDPAVPAVDGPLPRARRCRCTSSRTGTGCSCERSDGPARRGGRAAGLRRGRDPARARVRCRRRQRAARGRAAWRCCATVAAYDDGRFDLDTGGDAAVPAALGVDTDEPYLQGDVEWLGEPDGRRGAGARPRWSPSGSRSTATTLHGLRVRGGADAAARRPDRAVVPRRRDGGDRPGGPAGPARRAGHRAAARLELDLLRREAGLLRELPSLPGIDYSPPARAPQLTTPDETYGGVRRVLTRGSHRKLRLVAQTPATVALTRAEVPFTLHAYEHDPAAASYGLEAARGARGRRRRGLQDPARRRRRPADGRGRPGRAASWTSRRWPRAVGGKRADMAEPAGRRAQHRLRRRGDLTARPAKAAAAPSSTPRRWTTPPCSCPPAGAASTSSWRPPTWSG